MSWIIKCWVPIEEEKSRLYISKEELNKTIESLRLMQPENKYIDMGFKIKCYIPVDTENPITYATKEDAQKEIDDHLEIIQPENIYEAVETSDNNENGRSDSK